MGAVKFAKKYIENGEVKMLSKSKTQIIIQVGEYQVTFKKKAGYTLDSCSCQNHARFVNINPRCSHKLASAAYLVMRGLE